MTNSDLKSQIFAELSDDLAKDGANFENTEVLEVETVPSLPGRFIRCLRKIGGRFLSLVGKWGGMGFLLYVSVVQAVPEHTQVYGPTDNHPVIVDASPSYQGLDFHSLPLSGSLQMWVAEYGITPPQTPISFEVPFQPSTGDKFIFVPRDWEVPPTYTPATTGQFIDYRA